MKISFNRLNGSSQEENARVAAAMKRVADSGHYVLGPEVKAFEASFAGYIGTKDAIGVANGLEALQVALLALGIGPGDEVITTPISAVATALAITAVGAKPIFVDIDDFYHIDMQKIEDAMTPKTRAVIPVHLYGQPIDMDQLMKLAKDRGIQVIEDCCQAHGAAFGGKKVGSFGVFGCFSFYPTKNLGGIGDGGIITTSDPALSEKCRALRNYGQKNRYEHETRGINSRLDELQAAILSVKLKSLDTNNARRAEIAAKYMKSLKNIPGITLPKIRKNVSHAFHLFVIEAEKRDGLQSLLKDAGIDTLIHYPIPIHKQKCFAEYNALRLPVAEDKVKHILSLPMHPYLQDAEIDYICNQIASF
ncbi:MAG: WecE [Candidatus Parcubacteria bacterium]|nr:WecE [Candidatus Parcubacteria bacterium]